MENNQNKNLVLIEDLGMLYPTSTSKHKRRYGIYKCFCGKEFKAGVQDVTRKDTTSCGCKREKGLHTTHGLSKGSIYQAWCNMKSRVLNHKNKRFLDYGQRGIDICDEWKNDFMSFYIWSISNGYLEGLTIDRIKNDLGYSPDNCRWADNHTQNRNKRKLMKTNTSGYRGVSYQKRIKKWQSQISINKKIIYLGVFNCPIEAAKAYDRYIIENNMENTRNF